MPLNLNEFADILTKLSKYYREDCKWNDATFKMGMMLKGCKPSEAEQMLQKVKQAISQGNESVINELKEKFN